MQRKKLSSREATSLDNGSSQAHHLWKFTFSCLSAERIRRCACSFMFKSMIDGHLRTLKMVLYGPCEEIPSPLSAHQGALPDVRSTITAAARLSLALVGRCQHTVWCGHVHLFARRPQRAEETKHLLTSYKYIKPPSLD